MKLGYNYRVIQKIFSRFVLPYWQWWLLGFAELCFLFLKVSIVTFRFGDGTAYWYMADVIRHGVVPYRDFFLADPPIFIFFLVPIVALLRNSLVWVQLVPAVLEMLTAVGLFLYLKKEKQSFFWLAPWVYLFSFTILATSDYGTGLQLASCLVMGSFLLWQRKRYWWVGVLLALACLTKMYMAPVVIGIVFVLWRNKNWQALKAVMISGVLTSGVILLPLFWLSKGTIWNDVIVHQFNRPAGVSKLGVFEYFLFREWFLLILAGIGLWWKRAHVLVPIVIAELLFFLFFKDVYYAYLGALNVYITIFSLAFFDLLKAKNFGSLRQTITQMMLMLLGFFLVFSFGYYVKVIEPEGKFPEASLIAQKIQALPEPYQLYGVHEAAPLLALLSHRTVFENIIDSNTQTFASGAQDKAKVTEQALAQGVYVINRGGQLRSGEVVEQAVTFFEQKSFDERCHLILQEHITTADLDWLLISSCN